MRERAVLVVAINVFVPSAIGRIEALPQWADGRATVIFSRITELLRARKVRPGNNGRCCCYDKKEIPHGRTSKLSSAEWLPKHTLSGARGQPRSPRDPCLPSYIGAVLRSWLRGPHDYDVLDDGREVGRIWGVSFMPAGRSPYTWRGTPGRTVDAHHEVGAVLERQSDELLRHGVTGYGREALWDDYRLSTLWHIATPVWQCVGKIPPAIWWNHLDRIFSAVDDLDCRRLL